MGYLDGESDYLLNYDLCVCEDDICKIIKYFLKTIKIGLIVKDVKYCMFVQHYIAQR